MRGVKEPLTVLLLSWSFMMMQAAGARLYLQQQRGAGGSVPALAAAGGVGHAVGHAASAAEIAAAAAGEGEGREGLFQRADRLITASLAGVAGAFQQLDRSVHDTLDAQQGPAAPPVADQQVLQGALSRVLGLHHLRRVFSRLQLHEAPAAAAAAAPAVAAAVPPPVAAEAVPRAALTSTQALSQARRAVGFAQLLPANATVHGALEAARRTAWSARGRHLIQVG